MSLNTDHQRKLNEIWDSLIQTTYPNLHEYQQYTLKTFAAMDYADGKDTDLAKLFDQYIMLKIIKGLDNGNEKD